MKTLETVSRSPHTARGRICKTVMTCGFALVLAGCASMHEPHGHRPTSPNGVYETGDAAFYDSGFAGHRTASGERFNPKALTAAHRTLPLGTRVRVTDLDNDRHVTVRINDRGPYTAGRIIDLSPRAAQRLHMTAAGTAPVSLRVISEPDS